MDDSPLTNNDDLWHIRHRERRRLRLQQHQEEWAEEHIEALMQVYQRLQRYCSLHPQQAGGLLQMCTLQDFCAFCYRFSRH
jgi:hypothetical protein